MIFWIAAAVPAAGLATLMLWRAAGSARAASACAIDPTAAVYQRQLGELEELAARGLLNDADRRSAFAEAARRLLNVTPDEAAKRSPSPWIIPAVAGAAAVAALALYLLLGAPAASDQPFMARLAAWRSQPLQQLAPAEYAALVTDAAKQRPTDPQLQTMVGKAQLIADNPAEAAVALRRAAALAPHSGEIQSLLGQALVASSQDASVSPEAEAAFRRAADLNPADHSARYFLGVAAVANGRTDEGVRIWRTIREELPPGDRRREVLDSNIRQAEMQRTQAGAEAAFIAGMVERLAERLNSQPMDPDGWARLANAYAVLGRPEQRANAITNGRAALAGDPAALDRFETALRAAR